MTTNTKANATANATTDAKKLKPISAISPMGFAYIPMDFAFRISGSIQQEGDDCETTNATIIQ
jgi:hypothetical protein